MQDGSRQTMGGGGLRVGMLCPEKATGQFLDDRPQASGPEEEPCAGAARAPLAGPMLAPLRRQRRPSWMRLPSPLIATGWRGLTMRLAVSAFCIGAAGAFVGGGTLASFNATTTNAGNTFSTGSVLMSNTGTAPCTAVAGGNCGTLNLQSNAGMSPGGIATGTISITNAGTVPATLALQGTLNASSTASFNTFLNLTIHDDTSGYCVYGHAGLPYNGACDNLTGLAAQTATDAFPSASTGTGPQALPGLSGAGSAWATNEAHTLTVTVEVANSGSVPTGASGSLDLSWTGTSLPGTAQ